MNREWARGTGGIPVGNVWSIFLGDTEVLSDDGDDGGDRQPNGSVSGGRRGRGFGAQHDDNNRRPRNDEWGTMRVRVVLLGEDDTPGHRGEEGEESGIANPATKDPTSRAMNWSFDLA